MDIQSPPINHPEVARLRRQSAQRKYKKQLRKVRLLWVVAGVFFVALLIQVVLALCYSPRFWVYRLTVRNQETLRDTEVYRLMALPARSNYYRVSLGKLARNIEREQRIAAVEVTRGAIGELVVTVHERQALCRIGVTAPPVYMDADGVLFTRPRAPSEPVPVVEGLSVSYSKEMLGKRAAFPQTDGIVQSLQELLAISRTGLLQAARLTVFPAEKPGDETLTVTLREGTLLYLGQPVFLREKGICIRNTIAQIRGAGHTLADVKYIGVDFVNDKTKDTGYIGRYMLHHATEDAGASSDAQEET